MSQYTTPEAMVANLRVCPYDPAHLIEPSRLAFHVAKCKKNTTKKMKTCPFDTTHRIDESQLDEHVKNCPARIGFDKAKYAVGDQSAIVGAEVSEPNMAYCDESWGVDASATPYNPEEGKSNDVLSIPHGARPAERRAFRQEQRRNYGQKRDQN